MDEGHPLHGQSPYSASKIAVAIRYIKANPQHYRAGRYNI